MSVDSLRTKAHPIVAAYLSRTLEREVVPMTSRKLARSVLFLAVLSGPAACSALAQHGGHGGAARRVLRSAKSTQSHANQHSARSGNPT